MTSVAILYYFLGPYDKTRIIYDESPKFTIFLGFIFFGILFYSIYELITRKGEIILSSDGIEIRDKEWNHWDYVQSYWTITEPRENSTDEYLIVQLKDTRQLKCLISDLDKSREEILDLITMYKSKSKIYYD